MGSVIFSPVTCWAQCGLKEFKARTFCASIALQGNPFQGQSPRGFLAGLERSSRTIVMLHYYHICDDNSCYDMPLPLV